MKNAIGLLICLMLQQDAITQLNLEPILHQIIIKQRSIDSSTISHKDIFATSPLDTLYWICMQPVQIVDIPTIVDGIPVRMFSPIEFNTYLKSTKIPSWNKVLETYFYINTTASDTFVSLYFQTRTISEVSKMVKQCKFNFNYSDTPPHQLNYFFCGWAGSYTINLKEHCLLSLSRDTLKQSTQAFFAPNKWINFPVFSSNDNYPRTLHPYHWEKWFKIQRIDTTQKEVYAQLKSAFWKDLNLKQVQKNPLPISIAWLHGVYLGKTEFYVEYWVGYVDGNKKGKRQKTIVFNEPFRIHLHIEKKQ